MPKAQQARGPQSISAYLCRNRMDIVTGDRQALHGYPPGIGLIIHRLNLSFQLGDLLTQISDSARHDFYNMKS